MIPSRHIWWIGGRRYLNDFRKAFIVRHPFANHCRRDLIRRCLIFACNYANETITSRVRSCVIFKISPEDQFEIHCCPPSVLNPAVIICFLSASVNNRTKSKEKRAEALFMFFQSHVRDDKTANALSLLQTFWYPTRAASASAFRSAL